MALTVNTNIASLSAQRNLTGSQNDLSTSLQRLSSGLRINSAKDDAAGLAISERFTAQIKGLNQGVRNANDGISLAQTAEGALKEVTSNLQRIRELAVQSANATNSSDDRAALQVEVSQLIEEIERVATTTSFNGNNLLDGSFTSKVFQVGANGADTVSITSIASAKTADIGSTTTYTSSLAGQSSVSGTAIATGDDLKLNNVLIGASVDDGVSTAGETGSALAIANAVNAVSADTGVTATASTVKTGSSLITYTDDTTDQSFTLNGVYIEYTENTDATTTAGIAIDAINAVTAQTGVTASRDGSTGFLSLTAADGRNIDIAEIANTTAAALGIADATYTGTVAYSSTSSLGIQFHTEATTVTTANTPTEPADAVLAKLGQTDQATYAAPAVTSASTSVGGLSAVDISTDTGATAALATVDTALQSINSSRATLGAYQNRFESVVANSQTAAENLSASRSRIMDADFAQETAQLTKSQILQQSGIAMLAQANSIPQNVLALLQ